MRDRTLTPAQKKVRIFLGSFQTWRFMNYEQYLELNQALNYWEFEWEVWLEQDFA